MDEIWKPVVGYEGLYEVSNLGRVRSVDRYVRFGRWGDNGQTRLRKSQLISPKIDEGYYRVNLNKDGHQKMFKVHRLVAMAFIPNPDNLPVVNHKDENRLNNCVNNLEWCTQQYNSVYGTSIERNLKTRTERGYIDPTHIGLPPREIKKLNQRKCRQRKRESLI